MIKNMEYIAENIREIRNKIEKAALRSGRKIEDVEIIAVTKTVDSERINAAIEAGLVNLGENRVQELLRKQDIIKSECNWHLIGHLQTNKVKNIIGKVKMIHSVDSMELAEEIQNRAEKADMVINVLIQVNVAGEETKFGISPDTVMSFIKNISKYKNIKVRGLMTIAPYFENAEEARLIFREMKKIFIDINKENIDNIDMTYLSMGMSNDYEVAIEEGANIVRIGTAIFGDRQY